MGSPAKCFTGTWISTQSGGRFDFARPTPAMFKIEDIAGALSRICRFGGHGKMFYSVAEHCLEVHRVTERLGGDGLAGLLHDAQEAYLGDCVTPLKALLPDYRKLEAKLVACIAKKWGVDIHDSRIKNADRIMLWAEGELLVPGIKRWPGYKERPRLPFKFTRLSKHPMSPETAELMFMHRFKQYKNK